MYVIFLSILLLLSRGQAQDYVGYESALESYVEGLLEGTTYLSEFEGLATADPSALDSIEFLITATNYQELTAGLTGFATLPAPYNVEISSLLSSVYSAEYSIASKYGILSTDGFYTGSAPTMFTASATGSAFPSMTSSADLASSSISAPQFSFDTTATSTAAQSNGSLSSTATSHSNTLLSVTTPTAVVPFTPTGTPSTTIFSKAQAASTALPFVAGIAAFIAGGFVIGL